jgi:hypothetical protein
VSKLKRSEEQSLVDKVAARIPGWKGRLLNAAGHTTLVAATINLLAWAENKRLKVLLADML